MSDCTTNFEGETITTYELLERSARAALKLQREDGSFPPGRNGVYDEPETPVRTTSHWLTTLSKVYEITGNEVFASGANDAADYLLSDEARPYGYTFHSRNAEEKDKCDGLIGQAAPIRGLSYAGDILDRTELLETAQEVFFLHPFDERLGLWEGVEIDGTGLSFDRTMNHQLVFAAASSNLCNMYVEVKERIAQFLNHLETNLCIQSDGIVRQYVKPPLYESFFALRKGIRHWRLVMNWGVATHSNQTERLLQIEQGYLPVNTIALSKLHVEFFNHRFWNGEKIKKIIEFMCDVLDTRQWEKCDKGSMVPGLHFGVSILNLCDEKTDQAANLISNDIQAKYDFEENLLQNSTVDPMFQSASIWLLTCSPELDIVV